MMRLKLCTINREYDNDKEFVTGRNCVNNAVF